MLFISHSTLDKDHALDLQRRLRERGYVCEQHFLDSDQRSGIKLGEKWEKVIYDNLRDCQALLVLCSPNWLQSKWCFAELASAKMSGKQIFPIVVEDCDRSSLSEFQAVFINNPDLGKNEVAFERLLQDLEAKGLGPGDWLPWPNLDLKDANGQIDACPYPGLPAFDERYAAVYFGREREKQELLEELHRMRTYGEPRLLVIVGGSGCGKSSLLLAGVLPKLKRSSFRNEWLVLSSVRFAHRTSPNALFESLADDIVSRYPPDAPQQLDLPDRQNLLGDFSRSACEAAKSFSTAVRKLTIALGRANATALLPIDQFEEFLSESSASESERFLQFLKELCQHRDDRLVVVGTMRSDYLDVYERYPHHLKTPCFKEWRLEPFDLTLLPRIIQAPAARAHVDVDEDLVEQLKKDTPTADALPQLSFALEQLYRRFASGRDQPKMTKGDYTTIGRIDGLIKTAAEQLFDPHTQPNAVVSAVRLSFVNHLAEVSDRDEFVRLSAPWDDLDPLTRPILERFVSQRLLVKTERQGVIFLEVAHEALFRCWPLLNSWLKATADILRWRRDVRRDQQSAASSGRVWKGLTSVQFAVAKRWPKTRRSELTDGEVGWIRAASKRRSLAWTGLGLVAALIVVSACIAWWQRGLAEAASSQAVQSMAQARVETADSARTRGDYADTAYHYWHARDGLPVSNPLKRSIDGLLASWMPRAGRPFLFEWQQRSRVIGDPDLVPMDDRYQSKLFPVAFAPDASLVLTASQDRTVRLWNSSTGELKGETGTHGSQIADIAMSSSGGAFAVRCGDGTIWTWDTSSIKPIGRLTHDEGPIADFACTSDGKFVFLGCLNYARLWDVSSNQPCSPKLEHNLTVRSVAISPDDTVLISSAAGVKAWEITGQPKWQSEGFMEMVSAGFDSKSLLVAGGSSPNQTVKQLDIRTGEEIYPRHVDLRLSDEVLNGEYSCLAVSGDGSRIACGGFDRGTNRGFAMVWNAATGEPIGAPLLHPFTVRRIALSADGTVLFTTTVGGDVRWWDVTVGTPIGQSQRIEAQGSPPLLSPCGKYFLIRTGEQTAQLFDSLSGKPLGVEVTVTGPCQVLACSPDGKTGLLGESENTAQLWDMFKGEPSGRSVWEIYPQSAAMFGRRGDVVATSREDGSINVWDSRTGERLGSAKSGSGATVNALAVDSDLHLVLVGCENGEITLYDYDSGYEKFSEVKHLGAVNAVALSGDARRAISGGQDQTARIWNSNGTQVGEALVHDSDVLSVALSEDGNLALTGTGNGKAWLWDVPTGKLRGEVFRHWERPPSKVSIEAVAFVDDARVVTAERHGVVRQWAIRGLETSDADALRDRVALSTGWASGGDGVRQRLTLDQWRKCVAEQAARSSKTGRTGEQ